jgi:hypothetical protein
VLLRGVCNRCLSGAVEPRMFICPLSPAGATVQPRPLRRSGEQPPSTWGRVSPPPRRLVEAEQCPRRRARDALLPSRAQSAQPRAGPVGPPDEKGPGALQDVSFRLHVFSVVFLPTSLLTSSPTLLVVMLTLVCLAWAPEAAGAKRAGDLSRASSPTPEHRVGAVAGRGGSGGSRRR